MKNLFEYDVYDRNRDRVGFVENLWANSRDEIGFIGVKTGWLGFGRNHVIPAEGYTIDEAAHSILVPYDGDLIKNAPSLDADEELEPDVEREVYSHFGVARSATTADFDKPMINKPGFKETSDFNEPLGEGRDWQEDRELQDREEIQMPLMEEKLHVSKRETDLGEVRLRKVVRTETVNQPVELRHEDVIVERVTGSGTATPGDHTFVEQVASIPLSSEEAVINKTVESTGTVQARKVTATETQNVSDTVRKEDVTVERDVTARRSGNSPLRESEADTELRDEADAEAKLRAERDAKLRGTDEPILDDDRY
jgi:uncharacterized protein (TIGR02271 family)